MQTSKFRSLRTAMVQGGVQLHENFVVVFVGNNRKILCLVDRSLFFPKNPVEWRSLPRMCACTRPSRSTCASHSCGAPVSTIFRKKGASLGRTSLHVVSLRLAAQDRQHKNKIVFSFLHVREQRMWLRGNIRFLFRENCDGVVAV